MPTVVKAAIEAVDSIDTGKPVFQSDKVTGAAWGQAIASVEKFNQPGVFTTLHALSGLRAPREQSSSHWCACVREISA